MKYYTLQTLKSWNHAKEKRYLTGNKKYAIPEFKKYYQWMMNQMSKRLRGYNNEYAIWLWLSLDQVHIESTLNDDYVLLEVELPEDSVLLSKFDAWHVILNDGYFSDDIEGINQEEDWEMLFDTNKLIELEFTFDDEDYQGVTGKIDLKNIKVLKYILNEK
ncbi:DUF3841 domain-containing protein [Clostridium botulinum]|nr:DUF3841 domain-containing protein [Clostridium botulinum]